MDKNAEITGGGLKCDNEKCDWRDDSIAIEDYEYYINYACPKCGENVFTQQEYNKVKLMTDAVNTINQIPKEKIDEMMKNVTPEQLEQAEKMFEMFGFKKTGEKDEDGNDIWVSE